MKTIAVDFNVKTLICVNKDMSFVWFFCFIYKWIYMVTFKTNEVLLRLLSGVKNRHLFDCVGKVSRLKWSFCFVFFFYLIFSGIGSLKINLTESKLIQHDSFSDPNLNCFYQIFNYPVGWGCRINWLHLCRGVNPSPPQVSWIWH